MNTTTIVTKTSCVGIIVGIKVGIIGIVIEFVALFFVIVFIRFEIIGIIV
jgi:hypothetical protein